MLPKQKPEEQQRRTCYAVRRWRPSLLRPRRELSAKGEVKKSKGSSVEVVVGKRGPAEW